METRNMKRDAYNIARELGYERVMPDIKQRIYACSTETEITRIMYNARHLMR